MDFDFQGLTLASACFGGIEDRFQSEALPEIAEIFATPGRYIESKDGDVTAEVVVKLTFTINTKTDVKTLVGNVLPVKRPTRKGIGEPLYLQDGAILNQPGLKQENLFSIDGAKGKDT